MTVIAWDGRTLAADRRAVAGGSGGYAHPVTKVYRKGDALVGISGHLARGIQMMNALFDGGVFPPGAADGSDHARLLVVRLDGRIQMYESREGPLTVEAPYHAAGSGCDFALMAMHLGHDARKAVELTCELSAECGHGIDALTFSEQGNG